MKNYYLKFANQSDLKSTLISTGISAMESIFGTGRLVPNAAIALDIIGLIYKPTGVMLTNNNDIKYPEMIPVNRYRANLKAELTEQQEALLPLVPAPATPYRVWQVNNG